MVWGHNWRGLTTAARANPRAMPQSYDFHFGRERSRAWLPDKSSPGWVCCSTFTFAGSLRLLVLFFGNSWGTLLY